MKLRNILTGVLIFTSLAQIVEAESVRFAVMGDTQGSGTNAVAENEFSRIVQDVLSANPPVQFVVVVGDLVSGSKDDAVMQNEFQQWREIAQSWYQSNFSGLNVYVIPGNHDEKNPDNYLNVWQEAFPELPDNGPAYDLKMTYSFDKGPCHLVALNTSIPRLPYAHTVDTPWLRADLENSDKPIKLVFGHEPAYKIAVDHIASLDCQSAIRDEFWNILSNNRVKAYFCGHDHGYDHWIKDNVHQIITAGGGGHGFFHYLIIDADETDVTVSVIREPDNQLYEKYKLSDTVNVAQEDRTQNDAPYWPYNSLLCNWSAMLLIVLFCMCETLTKSKPI